MRRFDYVENRNERFTFGCPVLAVFTMFVAARFVVVHVRIGFEIVLRFLDEGTTGPFVLSERVLKRFPVSVAFFLAHVFACTQVWAGSLASETYGLLRAGMRGGTFPL